MIRKKLVFILTAICFSIGLTNCVESPDTSDYAYYGILNYNSEWKKNTIVTTNPYLGELVIGDFNLIEYSAGDCVFAYFTIDFDNQPSENYYTVTNFQILSGGAVPSASLEIVSELDKNDPIYNGVMKDVLAASYYDFRGKIIFEIYYDAYKEQKYSYSLICNPEDMDGSGVRTAYLRAVTLGPESQYKESKADPFVFDAYELIKNYGKDSIDAGNSKYKYKYLDLYIKYCNSIDEEGEHLYRDITAVPSRFFMASDAIPFY